MLGSEGLLGVACTSDDGTGTFAELTLSDVDLRRCVVGGRAVDSVEVSVVSPILNLEGGLGRGRLVAEGGRKVSLVKEEEVREKWGLRVARTTTEEKG